MPRFVVLHHEMPPSTDRSDHWDLMLEKESQDVFDSGANTLETWAMESQLLVGRTIRAQQLKDHRAWYLDNDGPVSEGRGVVTRQMQGEFEWITNTPDEKQVKLNIGGGPWLLNVRRVSNEKFEVHVCLFSG